jgi:hypothetical protein
MRIHAVFIAKDEHEAKIFNSALGLNVIMNDFLNELRGKLKHGHDFKTPDEVLEWAQDVLLTDLSSNLVN